VSFWAEDDHGLGLPPVVRRVWAPCGQRPIAHVQRRFQRRYTWLDVYGFVRSSTGQSWWFLLPTVTVPAVSRALAAFARDEGIGATHRVVLVVDQAGGPTSPDAVIPDGIDLVFLPAASPALQPAERLWPLVDEPVANRTFPDLDALEAVLVDRCRPLEADREPITSHTHYHTAGVRREPRRARSFSP
jgi:hypothetical protein